MYFAGPTKSLLEYQLDVPELSRESAMMPFP
jgi:hypothetical protein